MLLEEISTGSRALGFIIMLQSFALTSCVVDDGCCVTTDEAIGDLRYLNPKEDNITSEDIQCVKLKYGCAIRLKNNEYFSKYYFTSEDGKFYDDVILYRINSIKQIEALEREVVKSRSDYNFLYADINNDQIEQLLITVRSKEDMQRLEYLITIDN